LGSGWCCWASCCNRFNTGWNCWMLRCGEAGGSAG
jgi:hypothetical protein